MNKMENTLIQSMIRGQRSRNESHWPGKAMEAPAVTQYPNIFAEIEASGIYLRCPAEHAGVSQEIMAAVLEDGEELSCKELLRAGAALWLRAGVSGVAGAVYGRPHHQQEQGTKADAVRFNETG